MGFVKNVSLLDETHAIEDKFDFGFATRKIENLITKAPNFSIICLVGPYGAGKSTALHQIEKRHEEGLWFEFDAWRYPGRKDLWENFVLELARKFDEKTFQKVEKHIDGRQSSDAKALLKTAAQGLNLLIPGSAIIGNLEHFLQSSPATRTYQIQKILTEQLLPKAGGQQVVVVLEDIDRSGEAGIFFIETLKAYLRTLNQNIKMKFIVPVATIEYENNLDSYIKCSDITEYFRTPVPELGEYMVELLDSHILDDLAITQLIEFCKGLFLNYRSQMSPRKLKYILRAANSKYELMEADDLVPDARVVVAVEASKFLYYEDGKESLFRKFLTEKRVSQGAFEQLLTAITRSQPIHLLRSRESFRLEETRDLMGPGITCVPWQRSNSFGEELTYHIHAFYFDY